ncbi:hypothetical protein CYMTET_12969 [Cymbomonas tetramitiformis]|uniref:Uncharacterized protein n=1 Tax=Cymbomonas tetramitiformis TaxID=36881 RepID=A0AAE0GJ17_9CHLO|nr:hypothetical protein CYMTET_12969 [Cymbomonas tetramitiformis]
MGSYGPHFRELGSSSAPASCSTWTRIVANILDFNAALAGFGEAEKHPGRRRGQARLTEEEFAEDQSAIGDLTSITLDLKQHVKHTEHKKRAAFHKGSGEFIPFCGNRTCALMESRDWHCDCPNGGKVANSAKQFGIHSMSLTDYENNLYAE